MHRRKSRQPAPAGRTQAVYYRDKRGQEPVFRFIQTLPWKRREKMMNQVDEHLNGRRADAPPPDFPVSSQIDGELRELRVRFGGSRYRILYQRSGNLIVLLHAFEKNSGAIGATDITLAKWRIADFGKRMDAKPRRPPRAAGGDAP